MYDIGNVTTVDDIIFFSSHWIEVYKYYIPMEYIVIEFPDPISSTIILIILIF